MARGLKSAGMEELRALKRRVIRQHSMERISRADRDALVDLIHDIEARIISMEEAVDDDIYEKEV